ncbi:MAG: hypothetical protein QOJ73_1266 [Streptosporangiaceae bacterium]|jgi:hypothetical protein|nr:hypothetical protein [Streptosporangiaceae bacterium]
MMPDTGRSGALDWKALHLPDPAPQRADGVGRNPANLRLGGTKKVFVATLRDVTAEHEATGRETAAHCSYPIWQVDTSAAAENR